MRRLALILSLLVVGVLIPPLSGSASADVHAGELSLAPQQADVVVARDVAFAVQTPAPGKHSIAVQTFRTSARAPRPSAWALTRTVVIEQADRLLRFEVGQGRVLCVRVRDVTPASRTGWTPRACVTRAIDDQHLARGGGAHVVAGQRWPDGRQTDLGALGHVAIAGVPKGASVGPVSPGLRFPSCRMPGADLGSGTAEAIDRRITLDRYHAPRRRRVVCESDSFPYPRVGAIAIVPSWVDRPAPAARRTTLSAPYVGTSDAIEYTVTARSRVRFAIDAGWPEGPYDEEADESRTYDVQVRNGSALRTTAPRWRLVSTGNARRWHRIDLGGGRAVCVRARQHSYGLTSPWSEPSCLVRPRDDAAVRRSGSMRVVRERDFADRRATQLTGGRLSMRGVPKGARYGFLISDHDDDRGWPTFGLAGGPLHYGCLGGSSGNLTWCARPSKRDGTMVVTGPWSNPVGGLVVIPRWVVIR